MTVTYTATLQNVPMETRRVGGVNFARSHFTRIISRTLSTMARIYLCKIPIGATILNWWGNYHGGPGGASATADTCLSVLGITDSDPDGLGTGGTISFTLRNSDTISTSRIIAMGDNLAGAGLTAPEGFLHTVSRTTTTEQQFKWVELECIWNAASASQLATVDIDLIVMYTMDRQASADMLTDVAYTERP